MGGVGGVVRTPRVRERAATVREWCDATTVESTVVENYCSGTWRRRQTRGMAGVCWGAWEKGESSRVESSRALGYSRGQGWGRAYHRLRTTTTTTTITTMFGLFFYVYAFDRFEGIGKLSFGSSYYS